ncbi:oligosaccharide flippase family protein [Paenibacillus albidus]|uniref:lipopolysaccharide biosynthesis protein n=1 Tax=Paenibacillus albidus TaxID=2041023 RepID=UPI001BE5ACE0|nr:oligosaccharide flippase family protein [Paenibacillus albidus]MBT2290570.1 oligosaccharide flippase family protein [Paenibacillus albidus]
MSRSKQLAKNTAIIAFGKICTQFMSFFLFPLYTALLSTEEYGIVDLFSTYIMLLIPLITFQMEQALFRYLIDARDDENEKKVLVSTVIAFAFFQISIFFAIFLIAQNFIHNEYKYFLFTNVVVYIFSDIMLQLSRGFGDNKTYALGSFISALSTMSLNILFIVVFKLGAIGMFQAIFLANLFCIIFIFFRKKVYLYLEFKSIKINKIRELLKYSFPLVPNSLSWWALNASDRIVVSIFLGVASNGILAVSSKFSSIYISFYNIFNLTWMESATLHIQDEDRDDFFSNTISTVFRLFSSVCFCIIAVMPFLFPFIINEKFELAYYQIPIYMLAALLNMLLATYSVVYIALKMTKKMAKTAAFAGIINIISLLLMIKGLGLYAASISSVIAYGSMMLYRYLDINKYVKIRIEKSLLLTEVLMLVLLFFTYYQMNTFLHIIALLITLTFTLFINRGFIKDTFTTLRHQFHKTS